jgi:branched-chain amino acid transport system permease protein
MIEAINSGLLVGLIYVLVVLGVGFMSKVSGYFNLAQGSMTMVAAYAGYVTSEHVKNLFVIALASTAAGLVVCAVIDLGLARPVIRRLGQGTAAVFALLVVTVSASTILQESARLSVNSGQPVALNEGLANTAHHFLAIGQFQVVWLAIVVLAISGGLHWWLRISRVGLATRAVGANREIAGMMGVSIPRIQTVAIGISGITAGLAGFAMAVLLSGLTPYVGDGLLFTALALFLAIGGERPLALFAGGVVLGVVGSLSSYSGLHRSRTC